MAMNPRLMRPLAKTPPGTPASLLLRFNGADESTDFIDSSPSKLTVTATGDAQISTAQSQWGAASGYFDGDGDYLTVTAPAIGTSDFTLEAWARFSSFADYRNIWESRQDDGGAAGFVFGANSAGQLYVYTDDNFQLQGGSLSLDTWHHVALVRKAGVWSMYIDGVDTTATYTSAADLSFTAVRIGADWASLYFMDGYIDDLRLTPGLAVYTGPFIPPTQQLSAYATPVPVQREASLLLHFDGTNGSTTFTDSSQNSLSVTAYGDAQISTAQSKFGGGSGYFNGTPDTYALVPASAATALNSGDFCIEFWGLRVGGSNDYATAIGHGDAGVADDNYLYCEWTSSYLAFGAFAVGTIIAAAPSDNEWHHIAFTRNGSTLRLFIDGIMEPTATVSGSGVIAGKDWYIGAGSYSVSDRYWNGYIDDLRITKGLAVYTGPFVPPTSHLTSTATPQPIEAQASLLLHFDGTNGSTTFTDSSQNSLSVTAYGDAQISTAESKFGSGGGAFDGDGDYLQFAYSNQFNFASTDWTIEFWAKFNDVSGSGGGGLFAVIDDTDAGFVIEKVPGNNGGDGNKLFFYSSPGTFIYGGGDAIRMDDTDAWYHCAIAREGDTVRVFVNGVLQASDSCTPSLPDTSLWPPTIAAKYAGVNSLDGFMDDFRIVMGLAVYTASFTPPTAPLNSTATPQP